ncbi:GFA family protein [Romeria aff. gracilis LEGE 07310]|uniref:GFA family protein n=1 Tax=Vasconcelosia minhoensis LEGE 07310 TaxID=915328 RepID=A0A8J7DQV3_9CYAN|nr:GFA family protein [Romeria aff. gracilis LEGE 07310]
MISGECFCAAISYELEGTLQNARSCHCSRCRKAFSGASSAYAELAPGSKIRWTSVGSLATYSSSGGWGIGFCSNCGSTLCGLWNGEVHGLTLGCINGDPGVEIEAHLFVGSKASWDHIGGDAPQYDKFPVLKEE